MLNEIRHLPNGDFEVLYPDQKPAEPFNQEERIAAVEKALEALDPK